MSNEVLNEALVTLLKKATSGVESGIAFLSEQLPDVINQLLVWHFGHSLFWFLVGVFLVVTGAILGIKLIMGTKQLESKYWLGQGESAVIATMFVFAIAFGCFSTGAFLISENQEWFKIWLAPKVWLIEHAASLVK